MNGPHRLKAPSEREGDGYLLVFRSGVSLIPWLGPLLEKLLTRHFPTGMEKSTSDLLSALPASFEELEQKVASGELSVTEEGNNANGRWRRLSSGLQEVRHTASVKTLRGRYQVVFPASFAYPPQIQIYSDDVRIVGVRVGVSSFYFDAEASYGVSDFTFEYSAYGTYL